MSEPVSQRLALVGIALLMFGLAAPPASTWAIVATAPLGLLLLTGLKPPQRWSAWTAISMIPYFTWMVAETLIAPGDAWRTAGLAALTIAILLAGFDALRRKNISLR